VRNIEWISLNNVCHRVMLLNIGAKTGSGWIYYLNWSFR